VTGSKAWRFLSWRTGQLDVIESVHVIWREDQSPQLPNTTLAGGRIDGDDDDDDFQNGLEHVLVTAVTRTTSISREHCISSG
jgi:hypothetical protein